MKGPKLRPGPFRALLSLLIAVAAVWLAVSTESWAVTVLVIGLGILYAFFPPSGYMPRGFLLLAGTLMLLAGAAFLPEQWLDSSFAKQFQGQGIVLPGTYSPQPWLTWEDLTLLFAGLLWVWNCFEIRLSADHRQFLTGRYLLAFGLVAITTIYHHLKIEENLPEFIKEFGQFANRNQTGDILLMGGIGSVAQAITRIGRERSKGIIWIMMALLFLTAIILNGSRAALVLFALGSILVLVFLPQGDRHRQVAYALLALLAMIGILIFVSQGAELQSRFSGWLSGDSDWRLAIYQDTSALVAHNPLLGVGLGNFEGIFNTERIHSAHQMSRNLHPESDWWWSAAELGVPGALILALLVAFFFWTYLRESPFPQFTRLSLVLAVLFLIHTLFDVGGHRMGTAWSCLYLVGLGAFRHRDLTDIKIPKIALRGIGVFLLILALLRIQSMSVNPWMPTSASVEKASQALLENYSPAQQKSILDSGITWAPLNWLLYYQRGLLGLDNPDLTTDTDGDFNRALYLNQNSVEVAFAVGDACAHRDFPEAMLAWRKILDRVDPQRRADMFEELNDRKLDEKKRYQISTLAGDDTQLQAIAVIHQNSPDFDWYLQSLFDKNPSLQGISPRYLRRLMDRWADVGDVDQLIEDWPQHPEWQEAGWRAYALALAKAGRPKDAVTTALQFLPEPSTPTPPDQENLEAAEHDYQINPQDAYKGILLYFAQKAAGMDDQALETLQGVAKLPRPPSYLHYLLAKDLLQAGQDEAAWQAVIPALDDH